MFLGLIFYQKLLSDDSLKWCMTFVPIIRTFKHFWLLQWIWHQTRVTYPWRITYCSNWNHCIWSQELWEHKFLVLKNSLLFYRSLVEVEFPKVLWPYTMISVAAIGNTSWICDPSLVLYALEQPEMLRSHNYKHSNAMHNFNGRPLYIV